MPCDARSSSDISECDQSSASSAEKPSGPLQAMGQAIQVGPRVGLGPLDLRMIGVARGLHAANGRPHEIAHRRCPGRPL